MSSQSSQDSPVESPPLSITSLPTVGQDLLGITTDHATKVDSPTPPTSSMTPPPSSQAHALRRSTLSDNLRDLTPTPSALSSPPPTGVNGIKRDISNGASFSGPTPQQLADATNTQLREMLEAAIANNHRLQASVAEARMSAAHYKLQHNLLTIETEEAAKRMEVEHEMTRREVDVLQSACQGRDSPGHDYIARMKAYCFSVEEDNFALHRRLDNAKKIIQMKDDELAAAKAKEELLLERIRQNREHLNYLRSPGGIFHVATPKPAQSSYPATPQQYRSTPKHTPMTGRSVRQGRDHSQEPFAALLLADRVLSQENNSAPSTPVVGRRPDPRTPNRHNRGVQSLSSLPATPRSARPAPSSSTLLPSIQFAPHAESHITGTQHSRERRRKSRDSTISASDNEELARAAMSSFRAESEEVQESQASQNATEMLRIDPRESFEIAPSRTNTPTPTTEKSSLLQSKIFGTITKGPLEKRRRGDDDMVKDYSAKKLRTGPEIIGLGIGFDTRV